MIELLKKLALEAGSICLQESADVRRTDVVYKNAKDLVTTVDKKVEDYLVSEINRRYPDHDIIGEERGRTNKDSHCTWIIDPIDGTTSFVHGLSYYSVSIAYQENGQVQAGVVYAPALNQLFHATKGEGAYLNDRRISVSATSEMVEALLATGFACLRSGWQNNNLYYLNKILPKIRDIRRCGSAAIDLSYVAAGKFDGFWEMNLNDYDIAAGALLVQEAGGVVVDLQGGVNFPEKGVLATNGLLTEKILANFPKNQS